MAGMNLSSLKSEKNQEGPGIFSGPVVVVLIFSLLLALWGGMQWYLKSLDNTLLGQKMLLEENSARLQGESVDRVASFDTRLMLAKKQVGADSADSQRLLNQLERLALPVVRITNYAFDEKGKSVVVEGETDTFKSVAQQLASFKGEDPFTSISVTSLKKNEAGRILFSFEAEFN